VSSQNTTRINQLLKNWPTGTVAIQPWLDSRGVYRQLTRRYISSGWLARIGRGAFVRDGDTVDWLGGVYALQHQLGIKTHVAGVTALLLRGFGHYLPLGKGYKVFLFSEPRQLLPRWFLQHHWDVRVAYHCPNLFVDQNDTGFIELNRGAFSVTVSAPERAILEVMHLATSNAAVEHALELCEGLTTLRPAVVQKLLEACCSVKTKRFFLWASERSNHAWLSRVDISSIYLGKGKRVLYRGGKFDSKYGITVPDTEGLPHV
jgi:hypothetical protein